MECEDNMRRGHTPSTQYRRGASLEGYLGRQLGDLHNEAAQKTEGTVCDCAVKNK